jgi:hypothetical protein
VYKPHPFRGDVFAQSFGSHGCIGGTTDQVVEFAEVRVAVRMMDECVLKAMCFLYRSEPGVKLLWVSNRRR